MATYCSTSISGLLVDDVLQRLTRRIAPALRNQLQQAFERIDLRDVWISVRELRPAAQAEHAHSHGVGAFRAGVSDIAVADDSHRLLSQLLDVVLLPDTRRLVADQTPEIF